MADPKITLTAVDQTKAAFASVARNMDGLQGKAKGIASAFGGLRTAMVALSGTFAAGGLAAFAKSGINVADNLGKMAQQVGASVESLSALQYTAKLSNVSVEQLSGGLRQLAKNAADTQAGTGEARTAFQALGIAVTDAAGRLKSTDALLVEIAEKFAGMEDGAGKTALAMRLFGDAGAQLIPMLNSGSKGLADFRREAERLGVVMSTDTAKAAEQFNDNMTRLQSSMDGLKFSLAETILPTLTRFTDELREGARIAGSYREALLLFGTINPFRDVASNIKATREEIERLEQAQVRALEQGRAGAAAGFAQAIEREKKRLEFLKYQQRAAINTNDPSNFDARDLRSRQGGTTAPPLASTSGSESRKKLKDDAEFIAKQQFEAEEYWAQQTAEAWRFWEQSQVKQYEESLQARQTALRQWFQQIDQEQEDAIEQGRLYLEALAADAKRAEDAGRELGLTFSSALEDAVVHGKKFSEVLKGLAQDVVRLFARRNITEPAMQGLDNLFKSFKLPGFATGGSFMVGGSGGTDSQLVQFKATPGERVTIETPGQQKHGGGNTFHFAIDARGADAGVAQRIEQAVSRAVNLALQAVQAQADRGGSFARATGRR